jgi:signal transduction histidine kinase
VEAGVMLALPRLIPPDSNVTFTAVLDACLLTIGLAPLIWWLIVRPLQRVADFRHRMLALVLSAQEDERRIARDLHDGLGQTLTSMQVGLRTIEESTSDDRLQSCLRDLRLIGAGAHDEIRRLARGLRPAVLDDVGLIPALQRLLEDVRTSHQIEVHLELDDIEKTRLRPDVETALYRISQEAIANTIRHGAASRIDVVLRCDSSRVELSIRDNGVGFCPTNLASRHSEKSPFGLLSINERARLLGGNAWIESEVGAGAHVRVQLPVAGMETIDGEDSGPIG